MKKLIILSGNSVSGKTHTANAFKLHHNAEFIEHLFFYKDNFFIYNKNKKRLSRDLTLLIIENIPKEFIKEEYDMLRQQCPHANIIFLTGDISLSFFEEKPYVINCKNAHTF